MTEKKFSKSVFTSDYEILTDTGFEDIVSVHKTNPMELWEVQTDTHKLHCADEHVVFDKNMLEIYVKDLKKGDYIATRLGHEKVRKIKKLKSVQPMYDLHVNSFGQRYYTDGILSHNTTIAGLYLLWYAMFIPDSKILVTSYVGPGADEIMERIQYTYEDCPDFIRAGVTTWSQKKIVFDNKSSIVTRTTTENTGRGLSISLLYCLDGATTVRLRDKDTLEEKEVTLTKLYNEFEKEMEVMDIRKTPLMRITFSNDYYLDVAETDRLLVNDIKTTIDNIHKHDKILINQNYYTVKDIDYI